MKSADNLQLYFPCLNSEPIQDKDRSKAWLNKHVTFPIYGAVDLGA